MVFILAVFYSGTLTRGIDFVWVFSCFTVGPFHVVLILAGTLTRG